MTGPVYFLRKRFRNCLVCQSSRTDLSQAPLKSPVFVHVRVRIRGLEMLVFRKNLRTYLMDDPLLTKTSRWFDVLFKIKSTANIFFCNHHHFDYLVVKMVVYTFEFVEIIGLNLVKILYLQNSCKWNMYVLINKCQLNNDINNKVSIQKTFYSNFREFVTRIQNLQFYGTLEKGVFKCFKYLKLVKFVNIFMIIIVKICV